VAHVRRDFSTGLFNDPHGVDFYRPLVTLANRVDYSLYGLHPHGYHVSNLIFHSLNCLLLWLLLLRLGFSRFAAVLTASFFAVHPINVQDMVMVTGRCGLLGFLFSLLTLLFLLKTERWAFIAAGMSYLCALFSKESSLAVPLFYLAVVWFEQAPKKEEVLKRLGLLGGLSVTYLGLRYVMGPSWPVSIPLMYWCKFIVIAFPQILFLYAKLILVPILLYPNRVVPPTYTHWIFFTSLFCALACWLWTRKSRWPFFCLLWIVIALLPPTIVMVSKSLLHDHWAYPALLGFLLPLALLFERGLNQKNELFTKITKIGMVSLLIGWTVLAHWHIAQRRTDAAFFHWSNRFTAVN
jgi:hypothetical protein